MEEREIHYVMGSGNHARSYIHQTAVGKLYEFPVAWYAEKGGYWGDEPGFDQPRQEDFRRRISHHCYFCHNAYPRAGEEAAASGADPLFPGSLAEGIDCTRSATKERVRAAIVNPARLPAARQLDLCMSCHLETTSFRLPHALRRHERSAFSFRPGEALGDYQIAFDHPAGAGFDDTFEIAYHAYRLRRSRCSSPARRRTSRSPVPPATIRTVVPALPRPARAVIKASWRR